jgi:hypothetical protein
MGSNILISIFVCLLVPSKIATIVSVGEWPYVMLMVEIDTSILSNPASIAFIPVAVDIPVVA